MPGDLQQLHLSLNKGYRISAGNSILQILHIGAEGLRRRLVCICENEFSGYLGCIRYDFTTVKSMLPTKPSFMPFGGYLSTECFPVLFFDSIGNLIEQSVQTRFSVKLFFRFLENFLAFSFG